MTDTASSGIIWESMLDGLWHVSVVSLRPHVGTLIVRDTRYTGTIILSQEVDVTHSAILGPDVSDIAEWERLAMLAANEVDNDDPEGLMSDDG